MSSESASPSSVTWFLDYNGDSTNTFDPQVYDFIPGDLNTYVVVVVDALIAPTALLVAPFLLKNSMKSPVPLAYSAKIC